MAVPTDTVYGLIAVASDSAAVERVYAAKDRERDQPLPVFVGSLEQAELITDFNATARLLAALYWPGALTLVLPKKSSYRTLAAAGGETIGVRAPADAVLREFALQLGPLTGTSANLSGREECHTADDVRAQLGERVDFVVDAAPVTTGQPSTVADVSDPLQVRVIREGGITREDLRMALAGAADVS